MDDFICFGQTKDQIKFYLKQITTFLKDQLKLDLNPPQINKSVRGIPFLGYRIFPNKIRLGSKAKKRFRKKARIAYNLLSVGVWSQADFARHTETLFGFINNAESKGFLAPFVG